MGAGYQYGAGPRGYPRTSPTNGYGPLSGFREGNGLPRPANDNMPRPANDNVPGKLPVGQTGRPVPWDKAKPLGRLPLALGVTALLHAPLLWDVFTSWYKPQLGNWNFEGWDVCCGGQIGEAVPINTGPCGGGVCGVSTDFTLQPRPSGITWIVGAFATLGHADFYETIFESPDNWGGILRGAFHKVWPYANPDAYPTNPIPVEVWRDKPSEIWFRENIAARNSIRGYAEPLGYSLTDPLNQINPRQNPDYFAQYRHQEGYSFEWRNAGRNSPALRRTPRVRLNPRPVRPPRKNEKEKKMALRVAIKLLGMASEGCDVVEALYQALPTYAQRAAQRPRAFTPVPSEGFGGASVGVTTGGPNGTFDARRRNRGKRTGVGSSKNAQVNDKFGRSTQAPSRRSCSKQAVAVWDHFEAIDWSEAAKNLFGNEVEDRVIGGLSSAASKAFGQASGRAPGITWGPAL